MRLLLRDRLSGRFYFSTSMRHSALAFLVAHVILIATGSNAQLDGYVPGTASFFGGPPVSRIFWQRIVPKCPAYFPVQ